MGKSIKNHWARLIVSTAAAYQIAASLEGFFWPKIFFDFLTKNLDGAVKPIPISQTVNSVSGIFSFALEWPLPWLAASKVHRSVEFRSSGSPSASSASVLMYQGTNAASYYSVGCGVYFWAYSEGEVVCAEPWTLPKRPERRRVEKV